jgi:hypothetical protein
MRKKTLVIHQPDFLPYLGFFHRFLHADFFIVLDHVQFVNGSSRAWTHRDKIKTAQGEQWLTVSCKKAPRDTAINEIELLTGTDWRQDNLRLLEQNYRNAPFYAPLIPKIERLYSAPHSSLRDFNMASIEMLMDMLDVQLPWEYSSTLNPEGSKNELLVDLLKKVSATHYLSGVGARDYFEATSFDKAGIEVVWQEFTHPVYSQQFGEFLPYLSSIDLLFNHGIDDARKILRSSK